MSMFTVPDCICTTTVKLRRQNNKQCRVFQKNFSVVVVFWPRSDGQMFFSVCFTMANDPQVEDMRGELLRTKKEKTELQRARLETFQPIAQPHGSHTDGEEGRSGQRGPGTEYRSG